MWIALALLGCGGAEVMVTPTLIAWDEVDFQLKRPDGGYLPQQVTVRNDSKRALDLVTGEADLNFLLLSADMLVVSCRYDAAAAPGTASALWFGTGESMRIIATRQVTTADVAWDAMANNSVLAISRKRWEL